MDKYQEVILKIFNTNLDKFSVKTTYLYNELFISVFDNESFVFLWLSYKAEKIVLNKYKYSNIYIFKIIEVLISKYEDVFKTYLKFKQNNIFNIWDESEFINIYDNKQFWYEQIKNNLDFSFTDDYSYRRKIQNQFKFEGLKILDIYHSDFECSKCSWEKDAFSIFPDYDTIVDEKYFPNNNTQPDFLCTNITDYESITIWWNEKINEIISNKELLDKYDMLYLNKTCISVIMWDDIESIFKYNNIPKEKIFYTDQNTDSPYRTVINYLKNIELNNNIIKNEKLVFFWLNKTKNTFDLLKTLKTYFNIEVGNILLPSINIDDLKNILSYKHAIFFSWREQKAQNLFKLFPIENTKITIPYWLKNIHEFYYQILKIYNKENEIYLIDRLIDNYKLENKELFLQTKNKNVLFIIYYHQLKDFIIDNFRGINMLWMLTDMWFKINFFVYLNWNSQTLINNFINTFPEINIDFWDDLNQLEKFYENNIDLVYSEISNDKRIIDKNKIQITPKDFEYWLEGFFNTHNLLAKKLIKLNYINNYF